MATTSARALALLSMLGGGATVSAEDAAHRLGVSRRTVRRDVDTLRDLGYDVEPLRGTGGGYRLGPGGALPPLVLDEEQVVAVAVALQTASAALRGMDEAAQRALGTIRRVMPRRLRREVDAVTVTTLPNQWEFPAPPPDARLARAVGSAVRQRVELRLGYRAGEGDDVVARVVEPHHVVVWAARWYVVAYARRERRWDVLRLDRVVDPVLTGVPFPEREVPGGGPGPFVQGTPARGDRLAPWPCTGSAVLAVPASVVARFAPGGAVVRPLDDGRCELSMGAWSWVGLAGLFTTFGSPMTDVRPAALRDAFVAAAGLLADAAQPSGAAPAG